MFNYSKCGMIVFFCHSTVIEIFSRTNYQPRSTLIYDLTDKAAHRIIDFFFFSKGMACYVNCEASYLLPLF